MPVGGFVQRQVEGYAVESGVRDGSITRESAGFIAPGQSAMTISGRVPLGAGTTTIPLHTVPAGKVFLISDIFLSHDTTTVVRCQVQHGSLNILDFPVKGDTSPVELPGLETQPCCVQGQTLSLIYAASNGNNAYFAISGFEQDIGAQ